MDDLSQRSLRELLTLARERLGRAAANLKTRDELLAALQAFDAPRQDSPPGAPAPPQAPAPPGTSTSWQVTARPDTSTPSGVSAPPGASTPPRTEAPSPPRDLGVAATRPSPELARPAAPGAPGAAAGARVRDAAPLAAPPPVHRGAMTPAPSARGTATESAPAVVTRDFFVARH